MVKNKEEKTFKLFSQQNSNVLYNNGTRNVVYQNIEFEPFDCDLKNPNILINYNVID